EAAREGWRRPVLPDPAPRGSRPRAGRRVDPAPGGRRGLTPAPRPAPIIGAEARVEIRPFQSPDAPALAELSAWCAGGEADFVLTPGWESERELFAEFERFGIEPAEHLLVADAGDGELLGLAGFLRQPKAQTAGLFCPIVKKSARGRGHGGELLRAAL